MRTRHRQPTLVSMWMLDVFCCALGCVTLLWLINTREAKMRAITLGDTTAQLAESREELKSLNLKAEQDSIRYQVQVRNLDAKMLALVKERDENARLLALAREEVSDTGSQLALSEQALDDLLKLLADLESKNTDATTRLAKNKTDMDALTQQVAGARKDITSLQALLREKEKTVTDAARRAMTLQERLNELDTKYNAMVKTADAAAEKSATASADARILKEQMARQAERIKTLEKQVSDSNVTIVDLQGTKAKLADKVNQLQTDQETRFAGIAMTGKKVLFLVDISGSMDRLNYETPLATKWATVRETIAKVMKSLPDLESFQLIVFSDKMTYPLGAEGEWIKYDGKSSIDRVQQALALIKPSGDTNLYTPFESAFQFRTKGMDTIYLFSDGLPTQGPGLSDAQIKAVPSLPAPQRSEIMGNFLRSQLKSNWNASHPSMAKVRINAIGFFYESPDLGAFLWALARENDGSFVGMSRP